MMEVRWHGRDGQGSFGHIDILVNNAGGALTYCAAKSGVIGVTRALALEWTRHNIQVNALCPGFILTSLNEEAMKDEKILNATLRKTPAGRLGQASDMVGAVLFLASDASDYMTGQTLTVDGGWTAQ